MADIQSKILGKYGIDIAQENIFKLYKIEKVDLTDQELQEAFAATRKRWEQSVNGANEKMAQRDRLRLENASKYEAILKDKKMRQQLDAFYNGSSSEAGGSPAPVGTLGFAMEYFKLVATTKKITKEDVDFFFECYPKEKKNKKAILDMISKELKTRIFSKSDGNEKEPKEEEGKRKNENSHLIVNLFQKDTVCKLLRCLEMQEAALEDAQVGQTYPRLKEGLYAFLGFEQIDSVEQLKEHLELASKEVYDIRQEKGGGFIQLVDMINRFKVLPEYRDVVDNFEEFKLLVRYPQLTPYMYAFVDMKPQTVKGITGIAKREYAFRDQTDFILNYYEPVYDNFGISNSAIGILLHNAHKKAKKNHLLNAVDEKFGRDRTRKGLGFVASLVHFLVYWPIFAAYFVFEVCKAVFTELHRTAIPVSVLIFVGLNWMLPKLFHIDNFLAFKYMFSKVNWTAYMQRAFSRPVTTGWELFFVSLMYIAKMAAIYVIPCVIISNFIYEFAGNMNKLIDWKGYERTFKGIFDLLHDKTEAQFKLNRKVYIKKMIPRVIVNLVCLAVVIAAVYFIPIGIQALGVVTGYSVK